MPNRDRSLVLDYKSMLLCNDNWTSKTTEYSRLLCSKGFEF